MSDKKSSNGEALNGKKVNSDRILDGFSSDDDENFVQCEECGLDFVDVKGYEQHLRGKKHQKAINRQKAMLKVAKMSTENGASKSGSDEEDDESQIQCDVCQKEFSGHVPYYAHLKSNIHAKNLKKRKLEEQMKGLPEVLDQDNKEESGDDDSNDIIPKPIARCETCKKVFYGPESFHQHMKSSVHKKKNKQKAIADSLKSQGTENGGSELSCEVCSKSFSGPVPYMIHLKSGIHEKELNRAQVAEEIKEFCKETDDKHTFVCKECEKKFTDPFALKTHLASNDHEKQKAKREVMKFLALHPEVMMVKPVENVDSDDEAEDSLFFICKICEVSLTGPESAKLHVVSKNHISAKKKAKLMKQLKQKKVQDDANGKKAPGKENAQGNISKNIPSSNDLSNGSESTPPRNDNSNEKKMSNLSKDEKSVTGSNDDFELI